MRKLVVVVWLLSGCASQEVRCDRHLVPINRPAPGAVTDAVVPSGGPDQPRGLP